MKLEPRMQCQFTFPTRKRYQVTLDIHFKGTYVYLNSNLI